VRDEDLPVRLPLDVDLDAANPLASSAGFVNVACPKCRRPARRDTDTLEAYSSPWWYHWTCKGTQNWNPFDREESGLYMPLALMIGGEDQARTCFFHARMMARALHRCGIVEHAEPIAGLLAIGMVKAGGRKMSKSEGNAADPRAILDRYGADSLRFAILGAASPDSDLNWSGDLPAQAHSFLNSVWRFFARNRADMALGDLTAQSSIDTGYSLARKLAHQVETAVSRTTAAMANHHLHLVCRNLKMLFERIENYHAECLKRRKAPDARDREALAVAGSAFLRLATPVCPHIAEEIWRDCGGAGMIALTPWPATVDATSQEGSRA
jgi:leucyl-tRNA synthetase